MRKLLIENKENTDKHILIEASRNTSEDIQRINESLRKLSKRAEISINYRHLPYEQLRYTNLPNPNVSKFTPDVNVMRFISSMIKETTDANLAANILQKIIKDTLDGNTHKNLNHKS